MVMLYREKRCVCVCGGGGVEESISERENVVDWIVRGYLRNVNGAIQQMEKIGYWFCLSPSLSFFLTLPICVQA